MTSLQSTSTEHTRRRRAQRLLNRGADLLRQGQAGDAIGFLERAKLLEPRSAPILLNLGAAYILAGRHADAIPCLERAKDIEPDNPMIWINLGAAHLGNPITATGDKQLRAIAAFERALTLDPYAPSVHYNLGLILRDRGDLEEAVSAFRRALQVNPLDRDARSWIHRLQTLAQGDEHSDS